MTKLKPEDYLEPECVLCEKPIGFKQNRQMIPQKRISAKLDDLMAHQEYRQAEDLLQYWQGVISLIFYSMGKRPYSFWSISSQTFWKSSGRSPN
ncbi:MAG: hypothetical protein II704_03795, partial [Erysipelotrichaceae bacterium]|nr:hypothetical protein [Erysipelotrichaceae bacterium]